jgi:hypothetical protein
MERTRFHAGKEASLAFRIVDGKGRPLRAFDDAATGRMHVVVVRRDLTGFRDLRPTMSASGRWSAPLTLRTPGAYRAFVEFAVHGMRTVLGVELDVPGIAPAAAPHRATTTATTAGYVVRLSNAAAGRLSFEVSRAGKPVSDVRAGDLVVVRQNDLRFLHIKPAAGQGPTLEFSTRLPAGSRYGAFLRFRAGGALRTAAFTLES